jgi:type I restriction-modification system DNA methylase subunit
MPFQQNKQKTAILMQEAFETIKQLVADFKAQEAAYLSPSYQEQQVREDFINKFFAALGWDVTHERQKNPYEQEVKIENKVSTQGSQRRADYAFFIAPNFRDVKFYTEAKKPAKNLKDAAFYHQTIRYGWNSGTPIAILTDFEEFHILDCRYKPDIDDALNRKLEYFHYSEYADEEKFKKIFYLFGREAVANGSLEKYAATLPKPRGKAIQRGLFKGGYQPVDEAFLEELDSYRETLAKAFKKENPDLGSEELTEAIQRTIDRLVFICFLEAKQIEDAQMINYSEARSAWKKFSAHCRALEPKYNGLVFKKHRIIDDTDFVPPDDNTFADICDELADPSSPYDFDKIPISILGSIYERFLGKVVHATAKQVKVELKPEVRKAGGVYYTPQYIVRYIVQNTVKTLIEGKLPVEITKMSFADIACGSGSFLIEAYSVLLEYHERYYAAHPEAAKKGDLSTRDGKQVLSLKKRQEILVNNIFGVDIDFQATEVTQLSLYLKLLEEATLNDAVQFSLLKEKLLPDLKNNIVCGNSLIGTDINTGELFENKDTQKLKPMNFEDAFPTVMKLGGFDAVVGNPPWGASLSDIALEYLRVRNKEIIVRMIDSYLFFINIGVRVLRMNGKFGMIIPSTFLTQDDSKALRAHLIKSGNFHSVINLGDKVFGPKVLNTSSIIVFSKSQKTSIDEEVVIDDLRDYSVEEKSIGILNCKTIKKEHWLKLVSADTANTYFTLNLLAVSLRMRIRERFKCFKDIIEGEIQRGISPDLFDAFVLDDKIAKKEKIEKQILQPLILGKHIKRYGQLQTNDYIVYLQRNDKISNYPNAEKRLLRYKNKITCREVKEGKHPWYALHRPRDPEIFVSPKFIGLTTTKRLCLAYDISGNYCATDALYLFKLKKETNVDYRFVLGLLHSTLIQFFYDVGTQGEQRVIPQIKAVKLYDLPFPSIGFANEAEKAKHDHIVSLVEQMLKAKEDLAAAKLDQDVQRLEHRCATLDRQIDKAVYELYGLTEEEIKIVEGK